MNAGTRAGNCPLRRPTPSSDSLYRLNLTYTSCERVRGDRRKARGQGAEHALVHGLQYSHKHI